jgi:hypothetical protein
MVFKQLSIDHLEYLAQYHQWKGNQEYKLAPSSEFDRQIGILFTGVNLKNDNYNFVIVDTKKYTMYILKYGTKGFSY